MAFAVVIVGTIVARAIIARQRSLRFYPEARAVVDKHCVNCHSDRTTVPAFPIAAAGVELDTPEQMKRNAERILVRTVVEQNMPLLNKTGMTAAERALVARWIESGAAVPRSRRAKTASSSSP